MQLESSKFKNTLAIGFLFLIVFELISKFYKINQNKSNK